MKYKILFLIIFIFGTQHNVIASEAWTKNQIIKGGIFTTLTIIDWGQTRDIIKSYHNKCTYQDNGKYNCFEYDERANIILGSNPTLEQVDLYFPIVIGSILLASDYFENYRDSILLSGIVLEIDTIHSNYRIGLTINF